MRPEVLIDWMRLLRIIGTFGKRRTTRRHTLAVRHRRCLQVHEMMSMYNNETRFTLNKGEKQRWLGVFTGEERARLGRRRITQCVGKPAMRCRMCAVTPVDTIEMWNVVRFGRRRRWWSRLESAKETGSEMPISFSATRWINNYVFIRTFAGGGFI